MKSRSSSIIASVVTLLTGCAIGIGSADRFAVAQVAGAVAPANVRYQISAYAGVSAGSVHHGCYIVDTKTGQIWHATAGGKTEKVSSELP